MSREAMTGKGDEMLNLKTMAAAALAVITAGEIAAQTPTPYIGRVIRTAGTYCPLGWARTDGQLLTISDNRNLFSLIGAMYGGDGRTTFALPDLRDRTVSAPGWSRYYSYRRPMGQAGGSARLRLTTAQMPSHHHAVYASENDPSRNSPAGNAIPYIPASSGRAVYSSHDIPLIPLSGDVLSQAGSATPEIDIMQPSLGLLHCIAVDGAYPRRGRRED